MKYLLACICCVAAAVGCTAGRQELPPQNAQLLGRIDISLLAAGKFLSAGQSADGAWRSQTYGLTKDGPSLSPHVVTCLFFMPPSARQEAALKKGIAYLESLMDGHGQVRTGIEMIYPIYTAAEISRMVVKFSRTPEHLAIQAAWLKYLREFQMNESLGWRESDMEYGGWSYSSLPPQKPQAGKFRGPWDWPNLSATLYGLAAMRSAKVPDDDPSYGQALLLVQRCQNFSEPPVPTDAGFDDGGFFFTPAEPIQNKGGTAGMDSRERQRYFSYGSMTVDGLRALLNCGLPKDHPRVLAARRWLETNFSVDHNPGTFTAANECMRDSFYYYYCWGLAHCFMHLGQRQVATPKGAVDWAAALAQAMIDRQRPDGSWSRAVHARLYTLARVRLGDAASVWLVLGEVQREYIRS